MRITLERAPDEAPVYRQIAAQIRAEIESDRIAAGERLPTIRALAGELGVHRDTVAQAYDALASQGVVESTVGRGTFVTRPRARVAAARFDPSFSSLAERLVAFDRARPRFGSSVDAVPMHALIPDPRLYPADAFRKALNRVLSEGGPELLLYGGPQGHEGLRAALAHHFERGGLAVAPDEIVLCHGASQGISLALRLFCEPGDAIAVEEPTYNNTLGAALALGLRTATVPMRDEGLDLELLEATLARPDVKALYTIPTFHNPLGTTTSLEHRRGLLEVARRAQVPVIEDGYEVDLRLTGRGVPPLAALDDSGIVVHLFSFSKSLFPGARVGAIAARGRSIDALLALKQATDLSDALPLQAAMADFVESGAYDRHLVRVRKELLARRDAVLEALAREMPEGTTWTTPEGGYQIWIELPGGIDTSDLLTDAAAAGVLFMPGSQFYDDARPGSGLRVTFAMADTKALVVGVERLAQVVRQRLSQTPRRAARVHV
jgi:DNA-binding transcriptional MocR family regulator